MPAEKKTKNNKQQIQSVTDVTIDSLKKMLDKNDFHEFRNLVLGNYNNPQWLKSIGGENNNTQPTISFVGGIILQDAIMKIFKSMKANMFDKKRLEYFKSPVFVENFMTEIKHVTQVFEVKNDDENSTEFGKWILDVFNACFKVRSALAGDKATNECKRVLWDDSDKEAYMQTKQTKCYICERPWIGYDGSTKDDKQFVCSGSKNPNLKLNLNFVHCEHVVPFLAALYHVKLARAGDPLDDPILKTQYALAHNVCNELKNNFQMYMKASEIKTENTSGAVGNKRKPGALAGGTTTINVQDGGVATRAQAKAIIDNGVAPERLKLLVTKEKKPDIGATEDKTKKDIDEDLASEFQFMYVPNMKIVKDLYGAINTGSYEGHSINKNSTTLNETCGEMRDLKVWEDNNSYPILQRLKDVLKYINTNIDKLRTNNTPEEQVEMLYDLWGKFKLILAISPKKLDQIVSRGEITKADEGGGVQVGGAESDYDIMKEYIGESVKDLFGTAQLNIPLRITGRFKLILGMTEPGLNANYTYYEFKMTDRDGRFLTSTTETNIMGDDTILSVGTIKKIHETVDGIYKYTYDTKNNLKYLQKVNKTGELEGKGEKFFIMKDPTNSDIYAVEYVNFGEITNTKKDKTFGVYTVFSKDSGNRSLNSQGGGGNSNDIDSSEQDDDEENEGDVRYANFRRVSKTLRSKQKRGKTFSKNSKTFKKR